MKRLKRVIKILLIVLAIPIGAVLLYGLAALVLSSIPVNTDFQEPEEGIDIFIVSNGVHADICLPFEEKQWPEFDFSQFENPKSSFRYISFGLGDKEFYLKTPTWADLTFSTAAKAALIPTPTAMHVTMRERELKEGELIRQVRVSEAQLEAIMAFVKADLQTESGEAILIDCCRYPGMNDNFYEAKGSYHAFNTSNSWTNRALKSGEIRTALWAPFDWCILQHFKTDAS